MRIRRVAAALAGVMAVCWFAAHPASGATSRDGHGLFIADDDWNFYETDYSMPSLGDDFANLGPKMFRLQIVWNAMEPAPPNANQGQLESADLRERWVDRTHAMIDKARLQGVERIVLTLRANHEGSELVDVGTGGYVPSATRYELEIAKVVEQFAGKVDVWGGVNEPNLWQTGVDSVGRVPVSTLVDYQSSLAEVVSVWDPTAIWTSPDFNDETDEWRDYVVDYDNLGGGWGHVAAFHPYRAVATGDLDTVEDFEDVIPAGKEIWVTEVGAKYHGDAFDQASRASWIADTLAKHPRIARVAYYNMRGGGPKWDSGLLNGDFSRRPAWYVWCAAAHGDDVANPDCAPAAPAVPNRLAIAAGDGSLWLKEGLPGGPWAFLGGATFNARDIAGSGERLLVAAGDGSVWLKDGLPGGSWVLIAGPSFGASDVELSGDRLAVAAGDGSVWFKDGPWSMIGGTTFNPRDIELSGDRVLVAAGDGSVWLKDGLPGGSWVLIAGPSFGASDVEFSGDRMVVAAGDGSVWLKDGPWTMVGGATFDPRDIELSGDRVLVAAGDGSVWLKDGLPGGSWVLIAGPSFGARDVEFSGDRLAAAAGDGTVWFKDGPWSMIAGSTFDSSLIEMF